MEELSKHGRIGDAAMTLANVRVVVEEPLAASDTLGP
jgi:hypothetical protein